MHLVSLSHIWQFLAFVIHHVTILYTTSTENRSKAFSNFSYNILSAAVFSPTLVAHIHAPQQLPFTSLDQAKVSSLFYTILVVMMNPMNNNLEMFPWVHSCTKEISSEQSIFVDVLFLDYVEVLKMPLLFTDESDRLPLSWALLLTFSGVMVVWGCPSGKRTVFQHHSRYEHQKASESPGNHRWSLSAHRFSSFYSILVLEYLFDHIHPKSYTSPEHLHVVLG